MILVASRTSKSNASAKSSSNSCTPSSHSGKSPLLIASHRSRRWKSGSAPLILTASFHTTDCRPELRLPVELDERRLAGGVDEPERVDAEALHEPERAGDRPVRHRPHHHVRRLGHQRDEVPEVVVRRLRLREPAIGLLLHGVDEVGELDRVLDEEDRDVVADEVPVALLRVELHGEAADVAGEVERALVAGDGREADEHRRPLAGPLEQVGPGDVGQRLVRSRSSRGRRSRGRGRPARGCARGRSGRSSRGSGSPRAATGPRSPALQRVLVVGDRDALLGRQAGPFPPATWWVSPPDRRLVDQVGGGRGVGRGVDRGLGRWHVEWHGRLHAWWRWGRTGYAARFAGRFVAMTLLGRRARRTGATGVRYPSPPSVTHVWLRLLRGDVRQCPQQRPLPPSDRAGRPRRRRTPLPS